MAQLSTGELVRTVRGTELALGDRLRLAREALDDEGRKRGLGVESNIFQWLAQVLRKEWDKAMEQSSQEVWALLRICLDRQPKFAETLPLPLVFALFVAALKVPGSSKETVVRLVEHALERATPSVEQCVEVLNACQLKGEFDDLVEKVLVRVYQDTVMRRKLSTSMVNNGLTTRLSRHETLGKMVLTASFPFEQMEDLVKTKNLGEHVYLVYVRHHPKDGLALQLLDRLTFFLGQKGHLLFQSSRSKAMDTNAMRRFCLNLCAELEESAAEAKWTLREHVYAFWQANNVITDDLGMSTIKDWIEEAVTSMDFDALRLLCKMLDHYFDQIRPFFGKLWSYHALSLTFAVRIVESHIKFREMEAFFEDFVAAIMDCDDSSSALLEVDYLRTISDMAATLPSVQASRIFHKLAKRTINAIAGEESLSRQKPRQAAALIVLCGAFISGLVLTDSKMTKDMAKIDDAARTFLLEAIGHLAKKGKGKRPRTDWEPGVVSAVARLVLAMMQTGVLEPTTGFQRALSQVDLEKDPSSAFFFYWIALLEVQASTTPDLADLVVCTSNLLHLPAITSWSGKVTAIQSQAHLREACLFLLVRHFPEIVSRLVIDSMLPLLDAVFADPQLTSVVLHSADYAELSITPKLIAWTLENHKENTESDIWTLVAQAPVLGRSSARQIFKKILAGAQPPTDQIVSVLLRCLAISPSMALQTSLDELITFTNQCSASHCRILASAFVSAWNDKAIERLAQFANEGVSPFLLFGLHAMKEPELETCFAAIGQPFLSLLKEFIQGLDNGESLPEMLDALLLVNDLLMLFDKERIDRIVKERLTSNQLVFARNFLAGSLSKCLQGISQKVYKLLASGVPDTAAIEAAHLLLKAVTAASADHMRPLAHTIALQRLLGQDIPGLEVIFQGLSNSRSAEILEAVILLVQKAGEGEPIGIYFAIAKALTRRLKDKTAALVLVSLGSQKLGQQTVHAKSIVAFLDAAVSNLDCPMQVHDVASILTGLDGLVQPQTGEAACLPEPSIFVAICDLLISLIRLRREAVRRNLHLCTPILGGLLSLFQKPKTRLTQRQRDEAIKMLPQWLDPTDLERQEPAYSRAFSRVVTTLMAKNVNIGALSEKAVSLAKPFSFMAAPVLSFYLATFSGQGPLVPISLADKSGLWALCQLMGERGRDGLMATSAPTGREILKRLYNEAMLEKL